MTSPRISDLVPAWTLGTQLIDSIDLPIMVVARDCTVASFNQAAAIFFSLGPSDVGRSVCEIPVLSDVKRVEELCGDAIERGASSQGEVRDATGSWFVLRIAPYQGSDRQIAGAVLTLNNVTAVRASLEQAVYEREYAKAIINTVSDPLVVLDEDLHIQTANHAFYAVFQVSREESQGVRLDELGRADWTTRLRALVKDSLSANDQFDAIEVEHEFPAIGRRTVLLDARRLSRQGNLGQMTLLSIHDITERKRAERLRERSLANEHEARKQADKANRVKDEFLATVSHELRTPLNAIFGWVHILKQGSLDKDTTARGLEIIARNAMAQNQLISDLLDVSRIISGQLRCEMGAVDLMPVIEAALDTVRPAADAKAVELTITLDPAAGMVSGDATRLQQIVSNLLTNAVKFTSRNGHVDVQMKRQDTRVFIIVTDTGEGISPEFLPHIFDRFRQAEGTASRQHGGLGLGLAIVRHLVELHGGTVCASSEGVGKGSTFTVAFPLIAVHRSEDLGMRIADATSEQSAILRGVRVLVVDDERDARELLTIALTQGGAEVRTSTTAREALEVLDQWKPHVLVSDIGMPTEDGYEMIRKVRALEPEHGGATPAIALTGYASEQDAARARAAGYQLHIPKPVSPDELMANVARLVRSETQRRKDARAQR
jgi:two-component system CheB/CheR fusion protein